MAKEGSDNSSGTASVILGILSITTIPLILFAVAAPFVGLTLAIISLFFALSQKKAGKNNWSKWGMILSIIGIVLNLIVIFGVVSIIADLMNQYQSLCDAAGGCENIPNYLQAQQIQAAGLG